MALIKKIAFTGLMAAVGVVLFRLGRIVLRAVFEKPAKARPRSSISTRP